MSRRAYSYVRYSTAEQAIGHSEKRQIEMAERWCADNGVELDSKLTFQDLGVSAFRGSNVETGRLGEFLDAVSEGLVPKGSILIVENLDRLSRATATKALRVLESIVEAGIELVTLSDGQRFTEERLDEDPMALMMSILYFICSHDENVQKSRRVKAAWKHKREKANERPLTARCPGWLKLDKERSEWIVLRDRAEVVRRVFRMYREGAGQRAIAQALNEDSVPTFGSGKHWSKAYITKLLEKPAVVGTFTPTTIEYIDGRKVNVPEDPVPDYYPAVLSEEDWEEVQAMRVNARAARSGGGGKRPLQNVLAGLARCPQCEGTMTRVAKGRSHGKPYLVCAKAKMGAGCAYRQIHYVLIESALVNNADQIADMVPAGEDDQLDAAIRNAEGAVDGMETGLETYLDELATAPSAAIRRRVDETERQLAEQYEQLRELRRRRHAMAAEYVGRRVDNLRAALREEPLDRQKTNALLRQLYSGVTVDYETGVLRLQWAHDGETEVIYDWGKALPEDAGE